jgi:DNA-directed RNA polymerase subunit beta'
MALDPDETFERLRERVFGAIRTQFPIDGRTRRLELDGLELDGKLRPGDLRSQKRAKLAGETWAEPVYATLTLRDTESGQVLDRRRVRALELPRPTARQSFIVDGQEYQVDGQWQLRPGAYVRRRQSGEIETRFQTAGRPSFDLTFDPATKEFRMDYEKAKIPLYPILSALGVSDGDLESAWGKEILRANQNLKKARSAVEQFYRSSKKAAPADAAQALGHLQETLSASRLRPESTELTLGRPFERVTGEALAAATKKMLAVQAGAPEDDRDSLLFKDLRDVGDYAYDKIVAASPAIRAKALRRINTATSVRDIIKFDTLNRPVRDTFHKNSAAQVARQVNPVEMLGAAEQTTVLGPGGIQSERSITDEAKWINPSHLGFLDPIHTPEGSKTGVTLRLPLGVRKAGAEPQVSLYSLKTGKTEPVGPKRFLESTVVLPDQVEWEGDRPRARAGRVKVSAPGGAIAEASLKDADYVLRSPSELFSVTSNLIPFLSSTSGGRANMGARHIEQAISLAERQPPLVQVKAPAAGEKGATFEQIVGRRIAHVSPVKGIVTAVKDDAIVLKTEDGREHEVELYRNYPLNDPKSVLDSQPVVKVGDRVKEGDLLADTNFSKGGELALGTNLRVGYIPFKGYNFEDGIVISESAAKKLSSVHLYKKKLSIDPETRVGKKPFMAEHHGAFTKSELDKVGEDGVVRPGTRVVPGDPLVLATKKPSVESRSGLSALRKSFGARGQSRALSWDGETPGEVVGVHRKGDEVVVHVRTIERAEVGDKIAGRYGNKGIVTRVVPDREMPHLPDGRPIEVALNPSGIPGRMNLGQVLETAAAKIAEKTGRPFLAESFEPDDVLEKVKRELKRHGLSDTEPLFDPVTKQPLGPALVGPQHLLKLHHQVDKKIAVRSGLSLPGREPEKYDINREPAGGGSRGAQAMDPLGLYALLAHGARANIREMQTYKSEGPAPSGRGGKSESSQHHDVWDAIQHGDPLPPPRPTFAFQKFTSMLKGAGINVEKKGHEFILSPLTDRHILELTGNRALPRPAELLYAKIDPKTGDPKPKPGGLFDEQLTGGHGGHKWSRIELAEPVPNPIFERSIQALTNLSARDYAAVVSGERAVGEGGKLVEPGAGATGGRAIARLLEGIDVDKELEAAKRALKEAPASKVDGLVKKVKRLEMLRQTGLKPSEAYVLRHLPVLPPVMRPVSVLPDGSLKFADINQLYSAFAQDNEQLKDPTLQKGLTEAGKAELRKNLYDGVRAILGVGIPYKDAEHKGLLHQIAGSQPKAGFFQGVLTSRKQDLSMRSTIVPEPALLLDEVGLPKEQAMTLFAPFVVRELRESGVAKNVAEAQKMVAEGSAAARRALEKVTADRPVLLKRDPALHKYSVQAFRPRLVHGSAIQIHPLVTGGYNADFDGDTMSVFVPISDEARREALKMMPSNNLFSEATGKVMYQPTLEAALGLYKLSRVTGSGAKEKFQSEAEAIEAGRSGKIQVTDPIDVGGKKTTLGRLLLAGALPEPLRKPVVEDLSLRIDKRGLSDLFEKIGKEHKAEFGEIAGRLKDLGNGAAFGVVTVEDPGRVGPARLDPAGAVHIPVGTHSLSLDDFRTDKAVRESVLGEFSRRAEQIERRPLSPSNKARRLVEIWSEADKKMREAHLAKNAKNPSNLLLMTEAGVKPSYDQYKQMVLAPMLVSDASGRVLPTPITHSYAEGLDTGEYWLGMHGARRGAVLKVQEVREPGYLSKLLMSTAMDLVVTGNDCGTSRGIALPLADRDVFDRYLVKDFRAKGLVVPRGTLLTPDLVSKMRAKSKSAEVVVRSPLKCEEPKGLCQKCMGVGASGHDHAIGENVGVQAAQALGERAVQLTLKEFHTGGAIRTGGGRNLVSGFDRLTELTKLPKKLPNAATLAMQSGVIDKIEPDPTGVKIWISGKAHHVAKDPSGAPLWKAADKSGWQPPKVGMKVERGQVLSDPLRTVVSPHDLYAATGSMETVQNHLTSELFGLYKSEGVRRQAVETLVKAMGNLTKVRTPGDYPGVLRGEFHPQSKISALNRELVRQGKRPIEHEPVLKGVDMLPLALQDDWMARLQHERLEQTLLEAAATAGRSNLHGTHPIPGIAYGAEFGLTGRDAALRPSLGHLRDVPVSSY